MVQFAIFFFNVNLRFLKGYCCIISLNTAFHLIVLNITIPVLIFTVKNNILAAQIENLQQNLALLNQVLGFSSVEL